MPPHRRYGRTALEKWLCQARQVRGQRPREMTLEEFCKLFQIAREVQCLYLLCAQLHNLKAVRSVNKIRSTIGCNHTLARQFLSFLFKALPFPPEVIVILVLYYVHQVPRVFLYPSPVPYSTLV
ncbi:hypothetical protein L211DRAFT_517927 [Terfezia boudieri ATCC MYA-4762]|uniref:Uncharacterized protein n=1 Tax=Terfezia boudieri ATCC MYA-4762 TaxID=1051890 RepID=A0A3N4LIE6_9PEZI|nr:hypothetical protein L211DRAFT_517927 [Terfezia boudieri ATCC MYA-4762]